MERDYRRAVASQKGWTAFVLKYRQSDLWIQADRDVRREAEGALLEARMQVEEYARSHRGFLSSHVPLPMDPLAPLVVRWMLAGGATAGVGPMAAVAGAIARYVGERVGESDAQVVVENGGDLFLHAKRELTVGVFAGSSPLSRRIGLRITAEMMPMGIASSAASVGHSWSYGKADAACVTADDAALADAAATALGNRVKSSADMEPALTWLLGLPGIRGGLVVLGSALGVQGAIELVSTDEASR